ncbi:MAG: Hsp70 family protein [Alphaproteobacteria bacterium]
MLLQIHEPGQTPLPHDQQQVAIGIDLGTTNSVVAIARDHKAEIIKIEGHSLVPSITFYGEPKSVGRAAEKAGKTSSDLMLKSVKRLFEDAPLVGLIGQITPLKAATDILIYLKEQAEKSLGKKVTKAVITVPAYFSEGARTMTRKAATLAGFEVLRLLNEPTAAALAYHLDEGKEGHYVVYDLGGGTFDVSVLRLEKGIFQVLAVGGDTGLGGDDFDKLIQDFFQDHVSIDQAKQIKEYLSENPVWQEKQGSISQSDFEKIVSPLVEKTLKIVEKTLRDAKVEDIQTIQQIVCVGGMTRMPLIQHSLEKLFKKKPLAILNPDEAVALGAALQAEALMTGMGKLLIDVTPFSLGLETMGGFVEKLIPRNTAIPFSVTQEFTTHQDDQKSMSIHVLQGESDRLQDCRSLAKFSFTNLPPLPAKTARVVITFTLDADGILTVSAQEKITGQKQTVHVGLQNLTNS